MRQRGTQWRKQQACRHDTTENRQVDITEAARRGAGLVQAADDVADGRADGEGQPDRCSGGDGPFGRDTTVAQERHVHCTAADTHQRRHDAHDDRGTGKHGGAGQAAVCRHPASRHLQRNSEQKQDESDIQRITGDDVRKCRTDQRADEHRGTHDTEQPPIDGPLSMMCVDARYRGYDNRRQRGPDRALDGGAVRHAMALEQQCHYRHDDHTAADAQQAGQGTSGRPGQQKYREVHQRLPASCRSYSRCNGRDIVIRPSPAKAS